MMDEYSLKIERVTNGFVTSWYEEIEDDTIKQQKVFEDNEETELEAMQYLLYYVLEYFGMSGSKHDKERIRIEIQVQDE